MKGQILIVLNLMTVVVLYGLKARINSSIWCYVCTQVARDPLGEKEQVLQLEPCTELTCSCYHSRIADVT